MSETAADNHPRLTTSLVGQAEAEKTFLDAFNEDRMHHAWLLTGARGIGKATLAYRMARFLLVNATGAGEEGPGLFGDDLPPAKPDNLDVDFEDPQIQRVQAGSHGDLLVVTRSENKKTGKMRNDIVIDDVRRVINFFNQTATEGGWRIAVVDAVDELNVNAANALLKVLEEPPAKSILLLVAHSPGKLLPTIRSRCRQLPLARLDAEAIQNLVRQKLPDQADSDAALLAALADGAPGRALDLAAGDGLALYDQILTVLEGMPRIDVPALHAFADSLAGVKADARYRLFLILFGEIMERLIRFSATGMPQVEGLERENLLFQRLSPTRRVDQWLDLWEKMAETFSRADAVNLDRKQILLTSFGKLASA